MVGFALARAWVYLMFLGTATSSITWNGEPLPGGAIWGRRSCYAPPCSRARSSIGASRRLSIAAPSGSRTGPHHRRHACTRLRDAARCSVDRAMRAGLDLDRCRIGIDRSGVRRAVPQRRSSSHFVRNAARLPHRGGPLPRRARLAARWSMRDLCAAARDFRLDPVREAENVVVENRTRRAAFRDPLRQVLLEDRHMRMPHRHGRRRSARGFHHRERRDRGHLLPFPLAVVEPAYHRHHLRLRAVLQQDGPAPPCTAP